jgi:hypothetical protein
MSATWLNSKFEVRNSRLEKPELPAKGEIPTQRHSAAEPQPKGNLTQRRSGAEGGAEDEMYAACGHLSSLQCGDAEEEGKESFSTFPPGLCGANLGNRSFPRGFFLSLRLCVFALKSPLVAALPRGEYPEIDPSADV